MGFQPTLTHKAFLPPMVTGDAELEKRRKVKRRNRTLICYLGINIVNIFKKEFFYLFEREQVRESTSGGG